jgi:hypothetical protein
MPYMPRTIRAGWSPLSVKPPADGRNPDFARISNAIHQPENDRSAYQRNARHRLKLLALSAESFNAPKEFIENITPQGRK